MAYAPTRTRVERRIWRRTTRDGTERFEISTFADGVQRWVTVPTLDDARFVREMTPSPFDHRIKDNEVESAMRSAERAARVRSRADLTDAYSFIRRASQSLDRARSTGETRRAQDALARAEDAVAAAMKVDW